MRRMSRLRFLAKIIICFPSVVNLIRSLWVQITLYSNSINQIKFQNDIVYKSAELESVKARSVNLNTLLEILFLLRPKKIGSEFMIRIGPKGEGGYVLYNNLEKISKLISIGIAKDTSFEEDFSQHTLGKVHIELYDHTDRPVRKLPPNFTFHSIGIGDSDNPSKQLLTLRTIIDHSVQFSDISILKIDIDGAEYETLNEVESHLYNRFDQIIIELHDISELNVANGKMLDVISKILRDFNVIHLHPNSFEPWINVYGICLPKVLEITLLNKRYSGIFSTEIPVFPTNLDFPNQQFNEMILGTFIYPEPTRH